MKPENRLHNWSVIGGVVVLSLLFVGTTVLAMAETNLRRGALTAAEPRSPALETSVGRSSIDWPGPRPQDASQVQRVKSQALSDAVLSNENYANCRFGVGVVRNSIDVYTDVPSLRIGWYYDWRTNENPPTPGGVEYVQTIRLSQPVSNGVYLPTYTVTPPLTDLGVRVDANPGALWMVGNEPDRVDVQDDMMPDQYAIAYHDLYHFIKSRDPSARVAIGGVIQPTPLRLEYLDLILDYYYETYGVSMPVDVWNIHVYIIREVAGSWGAEIPPGISATVGIDYLPEAHGTITVFTELVEDFRGWMAARGQRNKPLIISEMGVLMPEWWQPEFTEERVIQFMNESFDYLLSATDAEIGYPADNNHLVQQWNWYSLDDDSTVDEGETHHWSGQLFDSLTRFRLRSLEDEPAYRWNGWLFDSSSHMPTVFGGAFASNTLNLSPTVDLVAYRVESNPLTHHSPTRSVTITLEALVTNAGNTPLTDTIAVQFYEISGTDEIEIGSGEIVTKLVGCAARVIASEVVWTDVEPGVHWIRVRVDPLNAIIEEDETNNVFDRAILISSERVFNPLILKSR